MRRDLLAYKVGLVVVGIFTIGLFIFVVLQASRAKQDAATARMANDMATKLNNYTSEKQRIPDSLATAGIKDVPPSVSYHKLSDEKYVFCVKYKAQSTGFDATTALGDTLGRMYYGNIDGGYYTDSGTLYLPSSHKKGSNCQTVKPYFYNSSTDNSSATADPYKVCDVGYNYAWSFLKLKAYTPSTGDDNPTVSVDSVPANTFQVRSDAKVFDRNCNPLQLSDLHPDDWIDLYFSPYGAPVIMIVKET